MDRLPVISSNLSSVGYDPSSSILEVEFIRGGVYQYYDVPEHVHSEFISSGSLGSYLHHSIKPSYAFSKI